MIREDVCYLIKETPGSHGVFDQPKRKERMVYCAIRSVSSAEYWRAHEQGLEPEIVFVLSDYVEYEGERLIRYGDGDKARYYNVLRTYVNDAWSSYGRQRANRKEIEITCEEAKAYVGGSDSGA